ncbi:autotransporter outer membrane beta-barrel domain-containing protein [Sphingomonas sp. VNH70]|uniref:autotransporter outer membrane beta-barrel domain-containing protein n=1 Tax=Sphingomonas silueang TaxID=3156617 RepID=UPI0032B426A1
MTSPLYFNSYIDNSVGTITGDVRFGSGSDTLVVGYADGALRTGISGEIDGGAGFDLLLVHFTSDAVVGPALTMPTGFENRGLIVDNDSTVTLDAGFASPGTIQAGSDSSGTIINRASLTSENNVFASMAGYSGLTLVNEGTIRTTAPSSYSDAVYWRNGGSFDNRGTVISTGSGVSVGGTAASTFRNSGSITARDTGVSLSIASFLNTGQISANGTGVDFGLFGSSPASENRGRISGGSSGVILNGTLRNSGTISSGDTGVRMRSGATLINAAGGVVSGLSAGIVGFGSSSFYDANVNSATVANAGTINGDVQLARLTDREVRRNRYFAERGGVLNGNLFLGRGGTLVVEFANSGPGTYAGITGSVNAPDAQLVYRLRSDASYSVDPGSFAGIGFDLYDDAKLTLTGLASARPLLFAGNGTVESALNLTAATSPIFILRTPTLASTAETAVQDLELINRGTLLLNRTVQNNVTAAVVGSVGTTFTNLGAIGVYDRGSANDKASAVAGGQQVVNAGTITLDGGIGVNGSLNVTNAGRIVQAAGGLAGTGVRNVRSLINTGTIEVGGPAAAFDAFGYPNEARSIVNTGRIASASGPAIVQAESNYYGNLAVRNGQGGTIAGTGGTAIIGQNMAVFNAGTIEGSVNLISTGFFGQSAAYVANGGVLRGNLTFGGGNDLFVETDGQTGVTGTIDGGTGLDTYRYRRTASGVVTLGVRTATRFERESVEALGADTVVTVEADRAYNQLTLYGTGSIVNKVNVTNGIFADAQYDSSLPFSTPDDLRLSGLASFTNQATIAGFYGSVGNFLNSGTIETAGLSYFAVHQSREGSFSFQNDGTIRNAGVSAAVRLSSDGSIVATNNGTITGGGVLASTTGATALATGEPFALVFNNSGTVTSRRPEDSFDPAAVTLAVNGTPGNGQILVNNSGTIEALSSANAGLSVAIRPDAPALGTLGIAIQNSGTIRANAGGREILEISDRPYLYTRPANAVLVETPIGVTAAITNYASGVIEATGARSNAIGSLGATLDITNFGTIRGGAGTVLADDDLTGALIGAPYLAGAVQGSDGNDRIFNAGTITGSISLLGGDDRVENYGRIEGDVFLGAGDDIFLHSAVATQIGTVDAGEGDDGFILDATGGGSVNGDQFVNFERFSQIGSGNVTYSGTFRFNTVSVSGGSVTVAAGQTLSSAGDTAITGSDGAETVTNNGTIAGSVSLGGGNDRVVNAGLIAGSVLLGTGDDVFVDQAGSRVTGTVDGGAGNDLYNVILAGNRNGLGSIRGFERLQIDGYGLLSLAQTEALDQIILNGTWLNLTQRGNRVGTIQGSDASEWVAIDGDASVVALAGGDDRLSLGTANAVGGYDGGTGNDLLTFANTGAVTLTGRATGFEAVQVDSGSLTVTGLLANNGAIWFGGNDLSLTVANGGTLGGAIDLGGGNDMLRLVGNAFLVGTASGGAGNDTAVFDLAGNRTLGEGVLTGFETLATTGSGILTLTGTHSYDRVTPGTDLTIAADGRLTARQVAFGAGDQRFTIAGQFAGAIDGGAGSDTISVSGGSASAPVAFDSIANVEAFAMTGGYATLAGSGTLGVTSLGGGRLVGLAGSTITASQINVGTGAVFGSSGVVNGNLTVAGVLSPGSSIGTMVVNGNVTLLGSSTSLFELNQSAADRLAVNGALTIQNGATLQLAPTGYVRPGTSFELITATGGITGSYTNIAKPSSLFGYVAQQGNRIALIGQFRTDATFNPQVARSVAYANRTLLLQGDNSALGNALPVLLTAAGDGNANPRQFALITPEAYASATQIGVDNALALAETTRGPAFATTRTDPGAYLFAQSVGQWHRLGADADQGISKAASQGYGYLGGIGYGTGDGMVGMFAGWLDTRQFIRELGARTQADGVVVGGVARYRDPSGFGFAASIVYNDAKARTDRFVPGANGITLGRYDLTSWSMDQSIYYAAQLANGWAITPRLGATMVRTTREAVQESGSAAFALNVARDQHRASFVDAGITFGRSETSDDPFRPFVTLGGRYQTIGTRADALGGYAGGGLGLLALGVGRAPMVATATGGVTYRYGRNLEIYAVGSAQNGRDDHQESILAGARLRF